MKCFFDHEKSLPKCVNVGHIKAEIDIYAFIIYASTKIIQMLKFSKSKIHTDLASCLYELG